MMGQTLYSGTRWHKADHGKETAVHLIFITAYQDGRGRIPWPFVRELLKASVCSIILSDNPCSVHGTA